MKVCLISRGDLNLFPPTQGASVKLFYTLKTLSNLGIKMYFVSAENDHYYEVKKGKFIKKKYPSLISKTPVGNFHKRILSLLGIPHDIFVIYHPIINVKLWLKLFYVVLKEKIDLIQAEFTAFGIPAVAVKLLTRKPVVLVEHNVESFQLPTVTNLSSWGKKVVKVVEKFACMFSDKIIVMSREERSKLERLGVDESKIFIIPHGVDLNLYKNPDSKKIRKRYRLKFPTLVFHGTYSYRPNYDAIKTIAEKILPELRGRGIKTKVLSIGDFSPADVRHPDIIFTGTVKDLPNYIDAADMALVPLEAGGGVRMKILEYFAARKPVVSTPKGAEGIKVRNGEEIILADIDDFPEQIMRLIKSKKMRKKLTRKGIKFVQDYDWEKICRKYIDSYKNLA